MKKYSLTLLLLIAGFSIIAQSYYRKAIEGFTPSDNVQSQSIIADDSNFVISGYLSSSPPYYDSRFFVAKLNPSFDTIWKKELLYTNLRSLPYAGKGLIKDSDSTYIYAAQFTDSSYTNYLNLFLIKLNYWGDTLWTKKLNNPRQYKAFDFIKTNDDNYLILASVPLLTNYDSIYLEKIDSAGNILWTSSADGAGYTEPTGINQSVNNDYFITSTPGIGAGGFASVYSFDSVGNLNWQKTFSDLSSTYAPVACSNGEVVFSGLKYAGTFFSLSGYNNAFIRLDSAGNIVWRKDHNLIYNGWFPYNTGIELANSDLIFAGGGGSSSTTCFTCQFGNLIRLNSLGDSLWHRFYQLYETCSNECWFNGMVSINNNTDIVAYGSSFGPTCDTISSRIWILKPDSLGCDTLSCGDFSLPASVDEIGNINSLSIYPNPTSNNITINFTSTSKNVSIKIYDATGRLVKNIENAKSSENTINVSELQNGLYILNLQDGNNSLTKRFVKQ